MPFVPRETYEEMHAHNAAMTAELQRIQGMGPIIELAQTLQGEIMELLDTHPEFSASKIGELAYRMALEDGVDAARDELVAEYEQAHRRVIYQHILADVEATEGDAIEASVRQRVETNPELAVELRDSARRELAARALDVVRTEVTAEQQAVIDAEAERQIELDRLDVELAKSGRLDLVAKNLGELLVPGDYVVLYVQGDTEEPLAIQFKWIQDAYQHRGWVYDSSPRKIVWDRFDINLRTDIFAHLGTASHDMMRGNSVVIRDTLEVGRTPVVVREGARGKDTAVHPSIQVGSRLVAPTLLGTDFRTRDLQFYSGY
jgi:hypothetical protein